ncbi:methyltransferase domain-containing protein [Dyella sedimenti]|uniref:methyltransferase domain-containing protein n=1 Tax=Dyella sedimenti TaxID=2919947 RepID=UPI001FAB2B23|nr:methyltransferase domain-containing protein [Dyella sedimenti]
MPCPESSSLHDALHALVARLEQDPTPLQPARLRERVGAMDRLEDLLDATAASPGLAPLRERASARLAALGEVQRRLGQAVRLAIMHGAGAHALRGWSPDDEGDPLAYDHLDALVADVLALRDPCAEGTAPDAEMVFYQPTPARHVLDLIARAAIGPGDVLVDLGSGLGHVPLLVSACTGARCLGIEREAAYVESAQRCAQALGLERVRFIAQDAREADLSTGTLFYLYTPFTGRLLRQVLDRLAREAAHRPIRLATLGPCSESVAAEPWLRPRGERRPDRVQVFEPPGVSFR